VIAVACERGIERINLAYPVDADTHQG